MKSLWCCQDSKLRIDPHRHVFCLCGHFDMPSSESIQSTLSSCRESLYKPQNTLVVSKTQSVVFLYIHKITIILIQVYTHVYLLCMAETLQQSLDIVHRCHLCNCEFAIECRHRMLCCMTIESMQSTVLARLHHTISHHEAS